MMFEIDICVCMCYLIFLFSMFSNNFYIKKYAFYKNKKIIN